MKSTTSGGKSLPTSDPAVARVGIVFVIISALATILNLVAGTITSHSVIEIISDPSNLLTFIIFLIFFLSLRFWTSFQKFVHIGLLLFATAVTVAEQYNTIYGISFWILSLILSYKYGLLETRIKIKIIILTLYFGVILGFSAFNHGNVVASFSVLLFVGFFLIFIYTAYKEELDTILDIKKSKENELNQLRAEKAQLVERLENGRSRLHSLEERIQEIEEAHSPVDLERFALTAAEEKIVALLVTRRLSNKEIARELNIAVGTVKQHLYNIYNKIGVDNRHHLIELCKYNYHEVRSGPHPPSLRDSIRLATIWPCFIPPATAKFIMKSRAAARPCC